MHTLLFTYGWDEEGGGTRFPKQVALGLAARGEQVSVIHTGQETRTDQPALVVERRREQGVDLFGIHNRPVPFLDLTRPDREADFPEMAATVGALLDEIKPQMVHFHNLLGFSLACGREVKKRGLPSLYTPHNYWPICPRLFLVDRDSRLCSGPSPGGEKCARCVGDMSLAAGFARRRQAALTLFNEEIDLHLAVSTRTKEIFRQNGFAPERIRVMHQCTATADMIRAQRPAPQATRTAGPLKILFLGSLLPLKGVHLLIQALQSFSPGQVEARIHGSGPAEYTRVLHDLDKKGLAQLRGGYLPTQLPEILAAADLLVVPSMTEDCAPLVLAEAQAAGLPIVGSRIGGIPDFVREGFAGTLFPPGDPVALANVLTEFINDPTRLDRFQTNGEAPVSFASYLGDLMAQYNSFNKPAPVPVSPESKGQKYSFFHQDEKAARILAWLSPYADLFKGCDTVLDIGCGPGHFLSLLQERGITGFGLDNDPAMVATCREQGLNAQVGSATEPIPITGQLAGIHLGHIIEHLPGEAMVTLIEGCCGLLKPDGLLLIRTPNWLNETVRHGGFWLDHTHVRPYPLELLEKVYQENGLVVQQMGYEPHGWNDTFILGQKKVLTPVGTGSE